MNLHVATRVLLLGFFSKNLIVNKAFLRALIKEFIKEKLFFGIQVVELLGILSKF